jgi:hypothetical protein
MEASAWIKFIFVAIPIYLMPSAIAHTRRHKNLVPILLVNIIFGWTIIGWVIALIWSFTSNVNSVPLAEQVSPVAAPITNQAPTKENSWIV